MKIKSVEPFILHPAQRLHLGLTHHALGVVGAKIVTEDGLEATASPARMPICHPIEAHTPHLRNVMRRC